MTEAIHAILVLTGTCFAAMTIGASFTFGVASICRWLEWAPVTTKVFIVKVEPTDVGNVRTPPSELSQAERQEGS